MPSRKTLLAGMLVVTAQLLLSGCEQEAFSRQDYPNQKTLFGNVQSEGIAVGFMDRKIAVRFVGVSYGPAPFDSMADKAIREIIGSSKVTCNYDPDARKNRNKGRTKYGRCYVGENDLALEMVKAGWLEIGYRKEKELGPDLDKYKEAQEQAKKECKGLWQVASWCT